MAAELRPALSRRQIVQGETADRHRLAPVHHQTRLIGTDGDVLGREPWRRLEAQRYFPGFVQHQQVAGLLGNDQGAARRVRNEERPGATAGQGHRLTAIRVQQAPAVWPARDQQ
jgi:hypothetical protein